MSPGFWNAPKSGGMIPPYADDFSGDVRARFGIEPEFAHPSHGFSAIYGLRSRLGLSVRILPCIPVVLRLHLLCICTTRRRVKFLLAAWTLPRTRTLFVLRPAPCRRTRAALVAPGFSSSLLPLSSASTPVNWYAPFPTHGSTYFALATSRYQAFTVRANLSCGTLPG